MKKLILKIKTDLKDKTKRKQVIGIMLSTFLLLGVTLAYMGPLISDAVKTNLLGQGDQIDELQFTKGATISFTPSAGNLSADGSNYTVETSVSATIIANDITDEATMYYNMYIDIEENEYVYTTEEQTPELILTIIGPDNMEVTSVPGLTYYSDVNGLSGFDITTFAGLLRVVENYEIYGDPTSTDDWTIKISMVNLDTDQGENGMKTITGNIELTSETYPYDVNITTVSNKTEDYSIESPSITTVSCQSSGTSYTWNYKYNSLDITSLSSEDYCTLTKDYNTSAEYSESLSDYVVSLAGNGDVVHEVFNVAEDNAAYKIMSDTDFASIANVEVTYPYDYDSETNTWTSTNTNVAMSSTGAFITFTIKESGCLKIVASISGTRTSASSDLIALYNGGTELFQIDSSENTEVEFWVEAGDEIEIEMEQSSSSYSSVASLQFYFTTDTEIVDTGYRYEGADPDNYVWFNGELWRIIGAMDTLTAAGEVETLTKIIATEDIGGWSWNSANTNDWPNSSLYKILNSDYYGATDGSSASSYCYKYSTSVKGNCDFTETGISASYRSMIENVVWSLGATSSSSLTADGFYTAERGTDVYTGRSTSTTGYIGLMYMSDYGYSAGSSCEATLGSYNSSVCAGDSWMYYGNYIWTIVPNYSSSYYAFYVTSPGYASSFNSYGAFGVVPVLYLKSNIEIVSGEGTASNPYILVAG